jgi:hypothetical protein
MRARLTGDDANLLAAGEEGPADEGAARVLPHRRDAQGRIVLDLPPGTRTVEVRLERTPPRRLGDGLTLAGLGLLPLWLLVSRSLARRRPVPV